ncbi:unnamed protein product, partial [Rotaria magnacalcarata]
RQNATTQAQISIEQQTADAVAAQVKPAPINNKQHKPGARSHPTTCRGTFWIS